MQKLLLAVALVLLWSGLLLGQHGTAPSGYYPFGYHGDTWTGELTAQNDTTREITLQYTNKKKNKVETFTGVLADNLKTKHEDGSVHMLKPSDIPVGTRLKVYYMPKTKKVDGKKTKLYEILRFDVLAPEKP